MDNANTKNNFQELQDFLRWTKEFTEKNNLCLGGFWTYDNDYFSWPCLAKLVKEEIIVLNERIGENPNPKEIDLKLPLGDKLPDGMEKIFAKCIVDPWYYKNKGKIMSENYLAKIFNVKNNSVIYSQFPKTREMLLSEFKKKIGAVTYSVHADWSGLYFLGLTALCGKEFNEKTFTTKELYGLRDFLLREKPKGAILSYVTSHPDCPIYGIDLSPVLNLFVSNELQYLKLLFVSKHKITEIKTEIFNGKKQKVPVAGDFGKKELEWVLAYSK